MVSLQKLSISNTNNMKKIGLVIVGIYLLSIGYAQPFESFFSHDYLYYSIAIGEHVRYKSKDDTLKISERAVVLPYIINTKRQFEANNKQYYYMAGYFNTIPYDGIREDSLGRIYRYYSALDTEVIWCDMSLNEGDTFSLPYLKKYGYFEGGRKLPVDSVRYINGRKVIYFPYIEPAHSDYYYSCYYKESFLAPYEIKVCMIEGIGPSWGPGGYCLIDQVLYHYLPLMWCASVAQLDTIMYGSMMDINYTYHPDSLIYAANPPSGCEEYGEIPVEVEEYEMLNYITLFPNPAHNHINIRIKDEILSCLFTLYDATGRIMYSKELMSNNNRINISHLSQGLYVATFVHGNQRGYVKFIKK